MAIDTEAARILLAAAREGVSFASCITLGRQNYVPGNHESRLLLRETGFDPAQYPDLFAGAPGHRYAEPFFRVLGAQRLESMDASAFEGATVVHDLNQPVPEALRGQFDVVYDGGTLEHVFDFQTAIRNCVDLVKIGGRVILHTPANNYFGHGFYQFSPELFYRMFCSDNGFVMERMIAMEYGPRRRWFEVRDPASLRARTQLVNPFPVLLYVQARKQDESKLFERCPQQSDYARIWLEHGQAAPDRQSAVSARAGLVPAVKRLLLERAPTLARMLETFLSSPCNRGCSFRNRVAFQRLRKPLPIGPR